MKGSFYDLFSLPLIAMILLCLVFFTYLILDTTSTATAGVLDTSFFDNGLSSMKLFDAGALMILFIVGIVAVLYSLLIEPHPILLILGIIFLAIAIFFTSQLSNTFYEISSQTIFNNVTPEFSISIWLMQHLPLIIGVIGTLLIIALIYKYGER